MINVNNSEYINFLEEDWCIDTKYENGAKSYEARVLMLIQENAEAKRAAQEAASAPDVSISPPASTPNPSTGQTPPPQQNPTSIDTLMVSLNSASFSDDKLNVIMSVAGQSFTCRWRK